MKRRQELQVSAGIHWVRGEIEQSITRARSLIDHYAESGGNPLQLQQAYLELHQVRGTAAMIQCFGMAAVAAEMASALHDIIQGKVGDAESLYSALLGATIQLSDYVQALTEGTPDCALIMQPTINELRLARGQPVLTEADIFIQQMQAQGQVLTVPTPPDGSTAQQQARRLRPVFQSSLLVWIRGGADAQTAAARVGKVAELIASHATEAGVHQLWRTAAAAIEAYLTQGIVNALELKRLYGRLSAPLRGLAESGELAKTAQAGDLALQLLFLVGRSTSRGTRVRSLREDFRLRALLPTPEVLDHQRRRIHGPSTSLLATVSEEVRSEFTRVKDQIDLIVRSGGGDTVATAESLRRIGDTLSALGLGRLQQVVQGQAASLVSAAHQGAGAPVWMDLAASILRVENDLEEALFRQMHRREDGSSDEITDDVPASRDLADGREALYREFLVNLARVQSAVDSQLRGGTVRETTDTAQLIGELASGLDMLGLPQASQLCERLRQYAAGPAFAHLTASTAQAERFADAIAAAEYYVESMRAGLPTAATHLSELARAMDGIDATLAQPVVEPGRAPTPGAGVPVVAEFGAGDDPEIRQIFLEEAAEVAATLQSGYAVWSRDPQDRESMTTLRRAFHTLKGSGRTVGALQIGDFGFALESMLNRCLDGSISAGPGVVETVSRALAQLPGLIAAFRDRQPPSDEINGVIEHAQAYADGRTPGMATEPDMAQIFREDANERLSVAEAWLKAHAEDSGAQADVEAVRAYHTVRGSARVVDAPAVSELAGNIEDLLDAAAEAHYYLPASSLAVLGEATAILRQWISEVGSPAVTQQDAAPWIARISELRSSVPELGDAGGPDRQLAEIFASEAFELISGIEDQLRGWSASPDSRRAALELKSLTHTLLGAAQMSSCPTVGTVARMMNRAFDGAASRAIVIDADALKTLLGVCEGLYQYLDRYRDGRLEDDDQDLAGQIEALDWIQSEVIPAVVEPAAAVAAPAVEPSAVESFELVLDDTPEQEEAATVDAAHDGGTIAFSLADDRATELPSLTPEEIASAPASAPSQHDTIKFNLGSFDDEIEMPAAPAAEAPMDEASIEMPVPADDDWVDVDAVDPEMLGIFRSEAEELIEGLDQSAATLERNPGNLAPLGEIMRLLHTFKGSARVTGLNALGDVAHLLESLFERLESGEVAPGTHFFARVHNALDGLHLAIDDLKRNIIPEPLALIDELSHPLVIDGPAEMAEPATDVPVIADIAPSPMPGQPAVVAPSYSAQWTAPAAPMVSAIADMPDGFDIEVAQTFSAEAEELMEVLEEALPRWQALPGDFTPARDMLRALHTYKGGARMAGLVAMGDASHELESLIEGLEYARELNADALRVVAAAVAELRRLTDRLQRGDYAALVQPHGDDSADEYSEFGDADAVTTQAVDGASALGGQIEFSTSVESLPTTVEGVVEEMAEVVLAPLVPSSAPTEIRPAGMWDPQLFWRPEDDGEGLAAQRRETARVPVGVLDSMLNEAGEISIYRSRMDEHNAAIQLQLGDMEQAIHRLRDQLRQLEIETEAQIAARGLIKTDGADRYAEEFDPLEMDRFTRMQELSRALNESIGDLSSVHASIDQLASEATTILLQQGRITTEVQQGLMRTLMVPFSRQVGRLQRVVQQTASDNDKRAEITFDGVEAELDRNVLERMTAPLEHLLRNAVIHGIERPDDRLAVGKPPSGQLRVALWREGTQLFMELTDDGRGLDLDAIRATAVRRGLMPEDATVSDDEAAQYIFMPGFSTAQKLTQDAGRGVGMDVVAAEVKQLGGSLELASEKGKGARFKIRLPLTLAMSQSLLVGVGHELFATPLPSVEGIARIGREELEGLLAAGGPEYEYGGQHYRVRHLADLVGTPREALTDQRTVHAILVRMPEGIGGEERRVAVVVDQLIGSRQIVSKSVGTQISAIPGVNGATILADGRVVMILDIAALVQDRTRRSLHTMAAVAHGDAAPEEAQRTLIMIVDDSITIRRVTERLLSKHGFDTLTAKDGLDAMAQLQT
ncbi:MAG: Hpt domain-containing protein, partial [Pseudomonadota bacterium]|nr:Hpt domain-containing protein [Pseudomonadota bacterium]